LFEIWNLLFEIYLEDYDLKFFWNLSFVI